jgi:hypothetical protein
MIDTLVFFGSNKAISNDGVIEFNVPRPRCLLQPLKAFDQTTHIFLKTRSHIPLWLAHVNFFIKSSM